MSDLFVDNIKHQSSQGSGTITIGTSGETVSLGTTAGGEISAAPAFEAYLDSEQSLSDNIYAKIQFNNEVIDTDNAFDNSTNYRFTVPTGKAGKYLINVVGRLVASSNSANIQSYVSIYKNGTLYRESQNNYSSNNARTSTQNVTAIMDLAVGDYIEGYAALNTSTGSAAVGGTQYRNTYINGYRLIGV